MRSARLGIPSRDLSQLGAGILEAGDCLGSWSTKGRWYQLMSSRSVSGQDQDSSFLCDSNLDDLDNLDWYQIDQIEGSAQSNRSDHALNLIYSIY